MPTSNSQTFLTTAEAAKLLRTHEFVLARMAREKRAPVTPFKIGPHWRWPAQQIERLAAGLPVTEGARDE